MTKFTFNFKAKCPHCVINTFEKTYNKLSALKNFLRKMNCIRHTKQSSKGSKNNVKYQTWKQHKKRRLTCSHVAHAPCCYDVREGPFVLCQNLLQSTSPHACLPPCAYHPVPVCCKLLLKLSHFRTSQALQGPLLSYPVHQLHCQPKSSQNIGMNGMMTMMMILQKTYHPHCYYQYGCCWTPDKKKRC